MKKIGLLLAVGWITFGQAKAQTDVDALRYSQTTFGGTARGMGIAGAFGALGGDLSSMGVNPAGLGMYRKSEVVFTPTLFSNWNKSAFFGEESTEYKYNFSLNNLGIVGVAAGRKDSKWKNFSYSFSMNRLADFHRKDFFHGINPDNSLLDKFVEAGNGISSDDITNLAAFDVGLAYETYLINPWVTDSSKYVPVIPDGPIQQLQTRDMNGKMDEYSAGFGANYGDRLYLGVSLGIPYLKYKESGVFQEVDNLDSVPDFNSYLFTNRFTTSGAGVNMKFGVQYRATAFMQIGGAVHTPTYYSLRDRYSSSISSDFDSTDFYFESPVGEFDYILFTPMKLIGSIAVLSNTYGFISIDYEWIDYGSSVYDFSSLSPAEAIQEANINQDISAKYRPASNLRIGAEGKLENFRVRAGYALYGSPFESAFVTAGGNNARTSYTGGLGYRNEDVFVDLAYVRTLTDEYYSPYTLASEPTGGAAQSLNQQNFLLSFGFKF